MNRSPHTDSSKEGLKSISVMLDWTPNTNHTGLYVAQAKGWYEEAGLNANLIVPGKEDVEHVVGTGAADFGVSHQEGASFARAKDVPVVSIAAVIQHNTSGFASLSSSGIRSPADFAEKRYGSFGSPIERPTIDLLMKCDGSSDDDVKFVEVGIQSSISLLKEDKIDFAWIFRGWEWIQAELQGMALDMIMMSDMVKDYPNQVPDDYTPILITNETMIADHRDTVKAFVEATAHGYHFAIENPQDAAAILLAANTELDAKLVNASQAWLADAYQAGAAQWGVQALEKWQTYAAFLIDNGLIKTFDAERAFTNDFLP